MKAAQGEQRAGTSVPQEPHVMGPQGRDLADGTCRHILVLAYSESLFFLYCQSAQIIDGRSPHLCFT